MRLKENYQIQHVLQKAGYYDISRIANEIQSYCDNTDLPIEDILDRIKAGEPWEYICGYTEFRGNTFNVTNKTLIPRIETEQIVHIALEMIKNRKIPYSRIIDVGTGSGCIITSLVKELGTGFLEKPNGYYIATDISREALTIARMNAKSNKVDKLIKFKKEDLIDKEDIVDEILIIANLPYIPRRMYMDLDRSVKDFEPRLALDGGEDGLSYYKKLISIIRNSKKKNIDLLFEIEPSTLEILKDHMGERFKVFKDFRGMERFILLHLS